MGAYGIEHDLRIKYGLTENPAEDQVSDWAERVQLYVGGGDDVEEAGRRAALEVFGELDAVLLFSEADTIQALLARAMAKN